MAATTLASPLSTVPAGKPLRAGLWLAQALVAAVFCAGGFVKLTTPIPELAGMMPWTGQVSPGIVRALAIVDIAGGLGILLPALTRIAPKLTVLAALGCVALQACAIVFHLSRGEALVVPLNLVLIALSAFVLWGRSRRAPILPR